jgi:NitT/TauT family transport system substrate-binding protein
MRETSENRRRADPGDAASINRRRALALAGGAAVAATWRNALGDVPAIRVGLLQFGSVAWQMETIRRHGLAAAEGIAIEALPLASSQATLVALQAQRVDVVVSDLLWVARQRATGADWAFVPYSAALGAVEVPEASPIRTFADLAGKRLGVPGTPLDKSWLILRLLARRQLGRDLDGMVEKSFGAPPLIGEQLAAGRLDAVLTYWQFAARLEAQGMRRLLGMDEAMRALGIEGRVPLVGYVVSEGWVRRNAALSAGFFRACRAADALLASSDEEWQAVAALTGTAGPDELVRVRDGYRSGIVTGDESAMRRAAAALYDLLAEIGGEDLVGGSPHLPQGTFLDGFGA